MSSDTEPSARLDPDNPWPGLLSFREADQEFFGGRDAAIEELFRRAIAEPLTLVFGPSGLGKTSLLRAGLFPRLRGEHFFPVYIRLEYVSGRSPLLQIKEEIVRQAAESKIEATLPASDETLWEYLHRRDVDFWDERSFPCKPVLVFDQFEELFTKGRAVIDELADTLSPLTEGARPRSVDSALANDHSLHGRYHAVRRYRVMLAIREDYVAQLYALSDRFRSVFANWFSVQRMTGEEALISIIKAGRKVLDEAVARRIIRFVGGIRNDPREEPDLAERLSVQKLGIEPALLSVICSELNVTRKEAKEEKVRVAMLSERREAILASFLSRSFEAVSPKLAVFIEDELVLDGKTRDSIAVKKALDEGVSEDDIQTLVERRVLRRQEIDGVARIELTHDLLTAEVAARRTRRKAAEEARKAQEERLAAARAAQEQAELERAAARKAQEDAEAAAKMARRNLRRTQVALGALAALFVAIFGSAIYIRFIREETRRKEARELFRSANRAFDESRDSEGLASLARALNRDPSSDTARTLVYDRLLHGGWWLPVASIAIADRDLSNASISISPDARRFVTIEEDRVALWDVATGKVVQAIARPNFGGKVVPVIARSNFEINALPTSAQFLSNPRFVRLWGRPKSYVWDTETEGKLTEIPLGGDASPDGTEIVSRSANGLCFVDVASGATSMIATPPLTTIRFAPDHRHFLILSNTETQRQYRIWDRTTRMFAGEPLQVSMVSGVIFTSDSRFLIVNELRGISVWDVATGKRVPTSFPGEATSIVLSPDDTRLVALSGSEARIFERNGTLVKTLLHNERVSSVVYSADGSRLLTTANDGTVRCWDNDGSPLGAPFSHKSKNVRAQFTSNGSVVTVSDAVRTWRFPHVYDEPLMRVEGIFPETLHASEELAVFEETLEERSRHVAISLVDGRTLWELNANDSSSLAVSPGSRFVAFGRDVEGPRVGIFVVDGKSGKPVWQQAYVGETVIDARFTEGDGILAILTHVVSNAERTPSRVHFISTSTWTEVAKPIYSMGIETLVVPSAGRFLALVGYESLVSVWDWRAGAKIGTLRPVSALSFSPDGGRLVAALEHNYGASLYDVETELRRRVPIETEGVVDHAVFSPDGQSIVISSTEVLISDAAEGKKRRRPISGSLAAAPHFSGDGKRAALAFVDDRVQVCDLSTGWPVTRPLGIDSESSALALMSTDGQSMFVIRDGMLVRALVPVGSKKGSAILVKLAEAVAGKRVSDEDFDPVDTAVALQALAKECAGSTDQPCRFVQWFYRDHARTISPLSSWTLARYAAFKPKIEAEPADANE
jgi:WD40 repeat protein